VKAPGKCRFFLWTVLHGRAWTAERRYRHGLQDSNSCSLCAQDSETVDHLLAGCVFSWEFWFRFLRRFGWQRFSPDSGAKAVDWWLASRRAVAKPRRKAFDSVLLLGAWMLWLERNELTFSTGSSTTSAVAAKAGELLELWCRARLVDRSRLFGDVA
jgi:hypothetical protein